MEYREKTKALSDDYISGLLFKITGVYAKDPDLIQAKREQLLLTREIRAVRAAIKEDIELSEKIRKVKQWSRAVEKLILKEAVNGDDGNRDK
jgi:hypothetical protein